MTGLTHADHFSMKGQKALLVPIPPSFFQQESAIPSGYASEHESIAFFHCRQSLTVTGK